VPEELINRHLDANCREAIPGPSTPKRVHRTSSARPVASIFKGPSVGPVTRSDSPTLQPIQRSAENRHSQKRKLAGDLPEISAHLTQAKRAKPTTVGSRLQAVSPLAERLRPNTLEEFVGQTHLTGPDSFLSTLTEKGAVGSIILWGPPG
jgi:putative ATPase